MAVTRAEIVAKMNRYPSGAIVCLDCRPEGNALTDLDRVRVMASDLPELGPFVYRTDIVRCAGCRRLWNPFTRQWTDPPRDLEKTMESR